MGNSALTCFRGRGKVKLVLLNGEMAEFKEPVSASTVMNKYPKHVILHCSTTNNRGTGQRRKISALRPEQALRRNEKYLLAPIQTTKETKPILESWAFFTLSGAHSEKVYAKIRRKRRPKRRWWIQRMFDRISKSLPCPDGEATRPLLHCSRDSIGSRKSEEGLRDWRPSLECIPESPTYSSYSSSS